MGVIAMMMSTGAASTPPPPSVTWNPADKHSNLVLSGGDLTVGYTTSDAALRTVRATLSADAATSVLYFECVVNGPGSSPFNVIGLSPSGDPAVSGCIGTTANSWGYYQQTGEKYNNNATTAYGSSFVPGDVIGVLLKSGSLYFRKNGTWVGDPDTNTGAAFTGLSGDYYPGVSVYTVNGNSVTARFTASALTGSLPSGATAWDGTT